MRPVPVLPILPLLSAKLVSSHAIPPPTVGHIQSMRPSNSTLKIKRSRRLVDHPPSARAQPRSRPLARNLLNLHLRAAVVDPNARPPLRPLLKPPSGAAARKSRLTLRRPPRAHPHRRLKRPLRKRSFLAMMRQPRTSKRRMRSMRLPMSPQRMAPRRLLRVCCYPLPFFIPCANISVC